ncbi:MAG: U32 family peptidase [Clostridiales bacterium]|nr:U32 family peptidase [Clostridiales bacterium]
MNKIELLAPAGSLEKAKIAFLYGADAIYAGTSKLSLRTRAEMGSDDLKDTIEYAHSIGKKAYVAMNIYARDEEYDEIIEQTKILKELKPDAIIIADGGIVDIVKKYAPEIPIHISTQANIVSSHSANFWRKNGASRVILARELHKSHIKSIIDNTPEDFETEIFVHGAICFGYSGRCYLSNYLANRSSNLGDCAQSCRWEYNVYVEENKKPGALMPVEYDEKGTYIFSSKDLCLMNELPEIIDMGVASLKIEGRLKTTYYLATVINAYRHAIDAYYENPENWNAKPYFNELLKTKTRGITTFYFNDKDNQDIQDYSGVQKNIEWEHGAVVINTDEKGITTLEIKNRLQLGDLLEIILPNKIKPHEYIIDNMYDYETNEKIEFVNPGVQGQKVKIRLPIEVEEGYIIRRKR